MEIPYSQLSPDALTQIIEEFVLREGTDYGFGNDSPFSQLERNLEFDSKVEQVRRQLQSGLVKLVYDADSETCNFIRA